MAKRVSLEIELKAPKKRTVARAKVRTATKLYRMIDKIDVPVTMKQFLEMVVSIAIDLSFQSRQRWDEKQKMDFLNSCVVDLNIAKFVLVNVKTCLEYATLKNDVESMEYFQRWYDKGIKYLNVDSNNRTTTVREFISGNLTLPLGKYEVNKDLLPVDINSTNNSYETLPSLVKDRFHNNVNSICMITAASREQLSNVFERMNSGESLNDHEKINCVYSNICSAIRDLADKYSKTFGCFFSDTDINRRKLDHWIAMNCYKFFNGIDDKCGKARKKKMYDKGSPEDESIGSFISAFNKFTKAMGTLDRFIRAAYFFDLFILTQEEIKLNKSITSYKDLKNDFISMISTLYNDPALRHEYTNSGVKVSFKDLHGIDPDHTKMRHKEYRNYGFSVSNYSLQLDSKRIGSKMDKLCVAERDGYKTNDGTPIDPDELFSGKYDLGHKKAYVKGGTLEIDNLVIEDASENRSHGSKETVVS